MGQRYAVEGLSRKDLVQEVDKLWNELQTDARFREQAQQAAIELADLPALKSDEAFIIEREGAGLDPATTAIIVSFSPLAAKVLKDLWDKVLLPRIQRDKGQPLQSERRP